MVLATPLTTEEPAEVVDEEPEIVDETIDEEPALAAALPTSVDDGEAATVDEDDSLLPKQARAPAKAEASATTVDVDESLLPEQTRAPAEAAAAAAVDQDDSLLLEQQ